MHKNSLFHCHFDSNPVLILQSIGHLTPTSPMCPTPGNESHLLSAKFCLILMVITEDTESKCRKNVLPSSLWYKTPFSRQLNCWSLRCSWSIVCRRCSNYIFILDLTSGFIGLGKDNYKMRREIFKFWDLVCLILETLRYFICTMDVY